MCLYQANFVYKPLLFLPILDDIAPPSSPCTFQPGPNVPPSCKSAEDCFLLFFGPVMLQFIIDRTNAYAEYRLSTMVINPNNSLYQNWTPITTDEMKGFIAVILNMGIIQLNNMKDYWATDSTTNFTYFRSVFSRKRFFQIFGMLHVGDINSNTKRAKIQPFFLYPLSDISVLLYSSQGNCSG